MGNLNYSEHEITTIVGKLFEANGYTVLHQGFALAAGRQRLCDFVVEYNQIGYRVVVKVFGDLRTRTPLILQSVQRLRNYQAHLVHGPQSAYILVVVGEISQALRDRLNNDVAYSSVILLDICNLLFLAEADDNLREQLLAALPFSINELLPQAPKLEIPDVQRVDFDKDEIYDAYIQKLHSWKPNGRANFAEYEQLCSDVLEKLFAEDLSLWLKQEQSNDGLFRFDLFCKIKHGNDREFWKMAEQYFKSKYIVFEFKNYSEQISQQEIFTTVKYLYAKALRSVAIMVAVNGANQHAQKAIRGILREEGKLIIALSNEDLIKMLEMKKEKKEPADYLSYLLDMLMVSLEK